MITCLALTSCQALPRGDAMTAMLTDHTANIQSLHSNVQTLSSTAQQFAHEKQAIALHDARTTVRDGLRELIIGVPMAETPDDLLTSSSATHLKLQIDEVRIRLADVASLDAETQWHFKRELAQQYPIAIDIALKTPGFSTPRVLEDAWRLVQIEADTADSIALAQRDALAEPYLLVQQQRQLIAAFDEAVTALVDTIDEQLDLAQLHVSALQSAAGVTRTDPVGQTLAHPQLRRSLLDVVRSQRGDATADRIERYLLAAHETYDLITNAPNSQDIHSEANHD